MPELPEVETIVNDLKTVLIGSKIESFDLLNQKSGLKNSVINFQLNIFQSLVINKKIVNVYRRAKHIVIDLGKGVIVVHLKMTGQLIYENKKQNSVLIGGHPILNMGSELPNKFTRAEFVINNGGTLYFNDVRRFGWIRYFENADWVLESAKSGLEPLEDVFSLHAFRLIIEKRARTTIKQAIMDAKYIVGVGNIYADESLFLSGIKPQRKCESLTDKEIKSLWLNIPKILKLSIENRGTSFNDYVDAKGGKGNFVNLLNVYGRKDKQCKNCKNLIKKSRIGGRGTHWCDNCQK